jgi:hypothetical protein
VKIAEALALSCQLSPKWAEVIAFLEKLPNDDVLTHLGTGEGMRRTSKAFTDTQVPDEVADYTDRVRSVTRYIRALGQ